MDVAVRSKPPPVATKPKKLLSPSSSTPDTPSHKPPAVKPKPKSPPQTHRKPICNSSSVPSTDHALRNGTLL